MSYSVRLLPAARRQLRKLPALARSRIEALLASLADEPRPPGAKKLQGSGERWRVRAGDYRAIYEIFDGELVVVVVKIGHRSNVYE